MNAADPKARVLAAARAAGAGAVRVCDASPDAAAETHIAQAVERGDFATWPYDRAYAQRAADPQTLLPGARSIVCIAVPFASPPPQGRLPLTGRVSNYAWAHDYHRVVRSVLERVASVLDESGEQCSTRIVCDGAPLAERAFAERAGLGWIGKHTNLIAPGLGSFVFLGEILTTLELQPDPPLRKSCGTCSRCVSACPTGALRGDYTIDATLCISDLTQRRDGIPSKARPLMLDWVWGCDLCQEACPPTRRAPAAANGAFRARDASAAFADLHALLTLRGAEFKRRYRPTAMGWRGPAVLRRNAAVALGNSLDRAAVPSLAQALTGDPSPMVRGHAAWALGRIGSPKAFSELSQAKRVERSNEVQREISCALEPLA